MDSKELVNVFDTLLTIEEVDSLENLSELNDLIQQMQIDSEVKLMFQQKLALLIKDSIKHAKDFNGLVNAYVKSEKDGQ